MTAASPPDGATTVRHPAAKAADNAQAKPTVVLVHGAWAGTSSWNGEVDILRRAGYTVRAIGNPLQNLTTDARTVKDFLKSISGPIVLVGHSYGGSVITNAAAGVSNVKALVYVDAAAPAVGETTGQLSGSTSVLSGPPSKLYDAVSYADAPAKASNLYLKKDVFVTKFASSVPRDQAINLWATQRAASTVAFNTPSKAAAWKTIPSWYFISSGDQIITPESEKKMARRAGAKVTVYPGGSHLTLVSDPAAVSKVIQSAIAAVK
ncbi:alpha/beta hydrolase [Streptomyces sp. NPDC002917]|nr:alpha/beta hydrolase [Streptomyces sp. NBC_00562]WTC83935.1 alpha/beta hydrolase [Streptomyces sp. NBC_01653]WTD86931.1 alpha/beta hydrolase [Streptomyces sp. NBC_01637]WUC18017.1 alpha/beta hydrolase [Streptomyces sp. NBC_00562]